MYPFLNLFKFCNYSYEFFLGKLQLHSFLVQVLWFSFMSWLKYKYTKHNYLSGGQSQSCQVSNLMHSGFPWSNSHFFQKCYTNIVATKYFLSYQKYYLLLYGILIYYLKSYLNVFTINMYFCEPNCEYICKWKLVFLLDH